MKIFWQNFKGLQSRLQSDPFLSPGFWTLSVNTHIKLGCLIMKNALYCFVCVFWVCVSLFV